MIEDTSLVFLNGAAVTVTAISNVIDTQVNVPSNVVGSLKNEGGIEPLFLVIRCGTAFTAVGAATCDIQLVSSSTADLATSPVVHLDTGVLGKAVFTANTRILTAALPFGDYKRYIGLQLTVATGPMTAGTLDAFLTRDPQFWRAFSANAPTSH